MKFKILLIICIIGLTTFTGCKGTEINTNEEWKYSIKINKGSSFVYTLEDTETGVNYIVTQHGVTPRLKSDGKLYITYK